MGLIFVILIGYSLVIGAMPVARTVASWTLLIFLLFIFVVLGVLAGLGRIARANDPDDAIQLWNDARRPVVSIIRDIRSLWNRRKEVIQEVRRASTDITNLTWGRAKILFALSALFIAAIAVNAFNGIDVANSGILTGYLGLVGGSAWLSSTPAFVVIWVVLSWWSGSPQIRATLRDAGDIAGRGLVAGLLVGSAAFALGFLPVAGLSRAPSETLTTLIDLSIAGTFVGFFFAQFVIIVRACRQTPAPGLSLASTPIALIVLLSVSSQFLSPRIIFGALVDNITRGLPHLTGEALQTGLQHDWRYAFTGNLQGSLDLVPTIPWFVVIIAVGAAVYFWFAWKATEPTAKTTQSILLLGDKLIQTGEAQESGTQSILDASRHSQ